MGKPRKLRNSLDWMDFSGEVFPSPHFADYILNHVNFRDASLLSANFSNIRSTELNFSNADVSGGNFSGAKLYWAEFQGANLFDGDFTDADLTQANFEEANLGGANLTRANLMRVWFVGANLIGINLTGVTNAYEATWNGVIIDQKTLENRDLIPASVAQIIIEKMHGGKSDIANRWRQAEKGKNFERQVGEVMGSAHSGLQKMVSEYEKLKAEGQIKQAKHLLDGPITRQANAYFTNPKWCRLFLSELSGENPDSKPVGKGI